MVPTYEGGVTSAHTPQGVHFHVCVCTLCVTVSTLVCA